jgi:hypothetical protein
MKTSEGKHPPIRKDCHLLRVDLVVFGYAAVDRFHIRGAVEFEIDPFLAAQIGDPISGEHSLQRHCDIYSL